MPNNAEAGRPHNGLSASFFMFFFLAWLSFSESLRGMFSVLRVRLERQGAESPALPESVSDRPASTGHPTGAGEPAGMPYAAHLKHFYSDMIEQELPDEILLFHLSRRLKGSENEISYNLQELLTSNNSFSEFLNAHQITFRKGAGNRIILCYRDRQISLENTMSTDVCYLRIRLGYNSGREDFCFNGFAFRDLLMKNQYTRQLQDCPEILERLESYLRIKGLAKEYAEKSEYYCFMYRFPIGCVIFDGKDDLTVEEKQLHLLNQVAYRLYQYSGDSRYLYDHDNPILRLKDDDNASVDCLVSTEIITSDMIE